MLNYNETSNVQITYQECIVAEGSAQSKEILEALKMGYFWWAQSTIILDGVELSVEESYQFEKEILEYANHPAAFSAAENMALDAGFAI